jgi:predicted TIM-barrel fold metal-dependent hydrolase
MLTAQAQMRQNAFDLAAAAKGNAFGMIIDAHCHLPTLAEAGSYTRAKGKFLDDLRADGVDYAILIPDNIPASPIGDVDTCLALLDGEASIFLLGTIDIESQGQDWLRRLEQLVVAHRLVGMKIFPGHDPIHPTDPRLWPVYELCQTFRMPMVIHTGQNPGAPEAAKFNHPAEIVRVAASFPNLALVIAHFYWPEVELCYRLTHAHPNIHYDISGLADPEVIEASGQEAIRSVLRKTITEHPTRVVFGSDYAMCSRADHIELIKDLHLPDAVAEQVFWRNAAELFSLPVNQQDRGSRQDGGDQVAKP